MPLNVIKGDILQMEVDAIVISANPSVCVGGELGKIDPEWVLCRKTRDN